MNRPVGVFVAITCIGLGSACDRPAPSFVPILGGRVNDACAPGLEPAADAMGCEAVVARAECPPGTMPELGTELCAPVALQACAPGFRRADDGWGCVEVLPALPCEGATLDRLGSATCEPVDDCTRPFPPSTATLFVDASFQPMQLDATHVRTISDALTRAADGAVIAIKGGRYLERLRARTSVTLVGECAARVSVVSTGDDLSGIRGAAGKTVRASGLTFSGHKVGAYVTEGTLILTDVVLSENRELGAFVSGAGNRLELHHCAVRDTTDPTGTTLGQGASVQSGGTLVITRSAFVRNRALGLYATDAASRLTVEETVVRGTLPDASNESGFGLRAEAGAVVELKRAAIVDNRDISVELEGAALSAEDSVIRSTRVGRSDLLSPRGLEARAGASVTLLRTSVSDHPSHAVVVVGVGTRAVLQDSVIARVEAGARDAGAGAEFSNGAELTMENSAIVSAPKVGLVVVGGSAQIKRSLFKDVSSSAVGAGASFERGGCVTIERSAFTGNSGLGALLHELAPSCVARLTDSVFLNPRRGRGRGSTGFAVQGSSVVAERVAVLGHEGAAIAVSRPTGRLALTDSTIEDTRLDARGLEGYGVVVFDGAGLEARGVAIHRGVVGLAVSGSTATVTGSVFSRQQIALVSDLGTVIQTASTVPSPAVNKVLLVTDDTRFDRNETRIGTGAVLLPEPF